MSSVISAGSSSKESTKRSMNQSSILSRSLAETVFSSLEMVGWLARSSPSGDCSAMSLKTGSLLNES